MLTISMYERSLVPVVGDVVKIKLDYRPEGVRYVGIIALRRKEVGPGNERVGA